VLTAFLCVFGLSWLFPEQQDADISQELFALALPTPLSPHD
jgi:hypothetical protein